MNHRNWMVGGMVVMFLFGAGLIVVQLMAPLSAAELAEFARIAEDGDPAGAAMEKYEQDFGLGGWLLRPTPYYYLIRLTGFGFCLGVAVAVVGLFKRSTSTDP